MVLLKVLWRVRSLIIIVYLLDNRAGAKSPGPSGKELVMNKRESMVFYHNVVSKQLRTQRSCLIYF